ncbi:MAG TPA: PEP/pyruvate-binding domain-containing protein, partial [Pseudobdellovibrionaceae bacterium]|nr:PEP/pyruvate-binding domain-containing protein [Pseudobdellovibrionaceae bacterium]
MSSTSSHLGQGSGEKKAGLEAPAKAVYFFAAGEAEGNAKMKNILGGKGANLAEMTAIGLDVPPGFTISTEVCTHYYEHGGKLPEWGRPAVLSALARVESKMGRKFGDVGNPLLVSVRSGARSSMPGMMDTILNLGLNDQTVEGLARAANNPRFAWDSYRRFIQMYSDVVMNMNGSLLDVIMEDLKAEKNYHLDTDLKVEDLKWLVAKFKETVRSQTGSVFPND